MAEPLTASVTVRGARYAEVPALSMSLRITSARAKWLQLTATNSPRIDPVSTPYTQFIPKNFHIIWIVGIKSFFRPTLLALDLPYAKFSVLI